MKTYLFNKNYNKQTETGFDHHNTQRKKRKALFIKLAILLITILLNVLSWNYSAFSDWYIAHIMPAWVCTYSRFMGLFPISVGEILIIIGILLLAAGIIIFLLGFFKSHTLKKLRKNYWNVISWILVFVFLIQTLNCFIQYHASTFQSQYMDNSASYGFEELTKLREHIVENVNALSPEFKRNEKGEIIYEGDMYAECIKSMKKLGEKYPNLSGYYPNPKKIFFSDFMSQQYLAGIYFPFTLEANYNASMYIANMPYTICHELAHLKGYIYEDEANFIAYMACVESDDLFFNYSGYINVLGYVSTDFRNNADEEAWNSRTLITDEVAFDNVFLTSDAWERVNKNAIIDTETVETISNKMLDGNLKMNGIKDGINSYSRVVQLLIYYNNS